MPFAFEFAFDFIPQVPADLSILLSEYKQFEHFHIVFDDLRCLQIHIFLAKNGMSLHWSKTEDVLTNTSEVDIWSRYLFHSNPFSRLQKHEGTEVIPKLLF